MRLSSSLAVSSQPPRDAAIDASARAHLRDRSRGVLYIATGAPFLEAARLAAESVRRTNPGLPIVLFGDKEALEKPHIVRAFDAVQPIANPHRRSKVDQLGATPFERTLYLDTDTRVYADLSGVFALLERFDVALTHAHARNRARTNTPWRAALPAAFPQFNGGVIAYRATPPVLRFLDAWRDAFHAAGFRKDQVTLRELLWQSDLRIATLPPEYNVRYLKYLWLWRRDEAAPKILHLRRFVRPSALAHALDRVLRAVIWRERVGPPAKGGAVRAEHADHRDPEER